MRERIRTLLFGLGASGTGGVHGDLATSAVVLNCVPGVMGHAPGLITMQELTVVAGRGVTP